jgi:4-amino-4-deoxy-L-arabinose transferase-like glycosyltransferase
MPSPDSRTWLWIILVVALVLRVGAAVGIQNRLDQIPGQSFLIEGDAGGYWDLAEDIAAGREYAIHHPPRRVLRMPGFPALLAIPMATLENPMLPARLMLALVGTIACGLVWWLGRLLTDVKRANLAAGVTAVSPVMVGFSPVILSETTFAACLLASLIGMAWWVEVSRSGQDASPGPSLGTATGIGLFVGLLIAAACYMRPSWLLAGPLFGIAAVLASANKGPALLMAACVLVGLVGALLPWGVRNQRVTGHFTLTTLWMGPSLYDGLNPRATGASDMGFFDQDNLLSQGMSEYDVDRHYRRAALDFVKQNPRRTLELAGIKLARFLKPWPNASQFGGWGPALLTGPFFVVLMVCGLRGWWVTRDEFWTWGLTLGPLLYFAALHLVFVGSLRYRLPTEYPLTILAAIGWTSWQRPSQTIQSNRTTSD